MILKYLTPKSEVDYLKSSYTTKEAFDVFKKHGYQAIPIVDKEGRYVGTFSEGDFMWNLIEEHFEGRSDLQKKKVETYVLKRDYKAVSIDASKETLIECIINQNFVPVVDARNVFIGIITRKAIIRELFEQNKERE